MHIISHSDRRRDARDARKRNAWPRSVLLCFFALFLFVTGIGTVLFSRFFTIEFINVSAPDGIDQSAVRSGVFEQMNAKRFALFSQKNIFLLSEKELEKSLKKQFVIDTFELKRLPPHTLSVALSGRPFRLLWVSRDMVYDVSSDGTLFRVIDPLTPVASSALSAKNKQSGQSTERGRKQRTDIPIIVDDSDAMHVLGESVITPDVLTFILDAWRIFDQGGVHPAFSRITEKSPTLTLVTTEGWSVILNSLADPSVELNHVKEVLSRSIKGQRTGLQYIDARFDNRVYYK